jgi:pyridinium-3,5-biscarboxylic acid mononucleotide sulfurtransferase
VRHAGHGALASPGKLTFELEMIQLDRHDATRLNQARAIVRDLGSVLVAYSGGVDSSLLLKLALEELGEGAVAVLASSPAYPESEQEEARLLALTLGARLVEVTTSEVELEAYTRNNPDRCFHCKEELFDTLEPIQHDLGLRHLAYGATADDAGDHRPGHGSAVRRGVRFPLLEAGMGKSDIRAAARTLGLPNWNKPSFACLSSRIPHGTQVTVAALRQIEAAEKALKAIGFRQVRVRHHGDVARIEVDPAEIPHLVGERDRVVELLRATGYKFVSVDLEGYSTGSLNRVWKAVQ